MSSFCERFKELTQSRGTMSRLSEAVGISTGLLSNYKNGKYDPTFTNAALIAEYFDVSLDWLAGREGYTRDSHKHRSPTPAMTAVERSIVDDYRRMDDADKPAFVSTAHALAFAGEAKKEGSVRPGRSPGELVT